LPADLYWPQALLYGVLSLANAAVSGRFFNLHVQAMNKNLAQKDDLVDFFYWLGKYLPIWPIPIVLFYIGTVEYMSGSIFWVIFMWPTILYIFIVLAMIFSMRHMDDRVGVDIHFTDQARPPLKGVIVLKVNPDNIRVRDGDTVMILDKNQVFKMEMVIPKKYLPT
jgi:hypothetical protein